MSNSRSPSSSTSTMRQYLEKARTLAEGTSIGIIARWITWPLENAYYQATLQSDKPSYPKIYWDLCSFTTLYKLNHIFLTAGLFQTCAKSFTNMGFVAYVDRYYSEYTSLQKGFWSGMYAVVPETLSTSRSEYRKVQEFMKLKTGCQSPIINHGRWSRENGRIVSASLGRSAWSACITFPGIYKTAELLEPLFSDPENQRPAIKAIAAITFSLAGQPLIMPAINYQTTVLATPDQPLLQSAKQLTEAGANKWVEGSLGRGICQAVRYGISFFLLEKLKEYHDIPR
jgi:hypothetical protein